MENIETITTNPAEDVPAPIEGITNEVPNVDFEKLYKNEKKRNKALFVGGTAAGAFTMFFWLKKMRPGLKALKEKKKAEKARKKAEKEALSSVDEAE